MGSDGSFVVIWAGDDASGISNIYVQKFDATGAKTGSQHILEGVTGRNDAVPQVSAVGSDGSFVVTWAGDDASGYSNIYEQKFDASGAKAGTQHMLEGVAGADDYLPRISAVGSDGSFVLTWQGDGPIDGTIYEQKFDASGAPTGTQHMLEAVTGGEIILLRYPPWAAMAASS